MQKPSFRIAVFLFCGIPSLILYLVFFAAFSYGLSGDSIIDTIQKSLPSLVLIKSENIGLSAGPEQLVKDESSSRLMVIKPVGVVQYSRNGAGVIIDPSGIIVTNAHTVAGAGRVRVILNDRTENEAKVILVSSEEDDLAFLQIETASALPFIGLADESSIRLGDVVYNVGSSEILRGAISEGRIIGLGNKTDEKDHSKTSLELVKINFDIYQGDSGGAVIGKDGRLIGLIVAGSSKGGQVSLAIPSNKIKKYYLKCMESVPR